MNYSTEKFIEYLEKVLKFDKEDIGSACPLLLKNDFRIFDYELGRNIHFFENVIYLAGGLVRSSFLALFTTDKVVTMKELMLTRPMHHLRRVEINSFYVSTAGIMAVATGNEINIAKYARGLFSAVDLTGTKKFSALDKALTIMYLKKSKRL